ncbi:hypothetical protein M3194_23085 [Paenibacillus glycanilyticus]|uniref:hypothetical protein n=1 Tax=Paenibacillus glycanilyticus TaxID=126569 RepID=UPI00203F11B7|nr:hypothetical protein [Paenibacillus glycanilyticus]MCM3630223.1 hypothetical protein [Paenibacillus glycanilyticus]
MTRSIIQITVSILCLIMPVIFLLFMYWDMHQPKIGPVGNGQPDYFTFPKLVPYISCFLMGALNLPAGVIRYRQLKREQQNDKDNEV